MDEQKSFFDLLGRKQAFVLGIIAGFLVLCTIGFFILLGVLLKGKVFLGEAKTSSGAKVPEKFSQCVDSGKYAAKVQSDEQLGASLGVNGTPATFVNGYLISGALPYDAVKQVIDAAIAGKKLDFDFMKDDKGEIKKVDIPNLSDAVWRGNQNASVAVVEFSDFECPYCARFAPTIEKIVNEYKTQIKFTYRHFPLSFHANAQKAAEAFECAKEQGKTWEMYDKLFELSGKQQLNLENVKKAAGELGFK